MRVSCYVLNSGRYLCIKKKNEYKTEVIPNVAMFEYRYTYNEIALVGEGFFKGNRGKQFFV